MLGKKGQLTILDLVLVPIVAVVLSILAVSFLNSATANLINSVNQEPAAQTCNFALDTLFGSYYVDTPSALNALGLSHPDQYQTAISSQQSSLSASCGPECNLGYNVLSNSLSNFTSLFSDFINYFSSFSVNSFNNVAAGSAVTLRNLHMRVYLNQIPITSAGSTICSLTVFNPEDPSNPYTIFGVLS